MILGLFALAQAQARRAKMEFRDALKDTRGMMIPLVDTIFPIMVEDMLENVKEGDFKQTIDGAEMVSIYS